MKKVLSFVVDMITENIKWKLIILCTKIQKRGKKLKSFVKRKSDGINFFPCSDVYMKTKVEPFNDEIPLKLKLIYK